MKKKKKLLGWVFIAKCIGITFVVIGHFHFRSTPAYWDYLVKSIYTFHMPLFFFLSGYLFDRSKYTYKFLIINKTKRLLYPFITISIIAFIIKYLAGIFFKLDHPIVFTNVISLFLNPVESYMPLLWYIHALFLMFLIYPLLKHFVKYDIIIITLFILINLLFGHNFPLIGKAILEFPYFIIGTIFRNIGESRNRIIGGKSIQILFSLLSFSLFHMILFELHAVSILSHIWRLLLGISGVISIINISRLLDSKIRSNIIKKILMEIGIYSMTIYLLHTFFESLVRISFNQIYVNFPLKFEFVAFIAITAGILFPMFLEKRIFRRNKFTRKYLLGLSTDFEM